MNRRLVYFLTGIVIFIFLGWYFGNIFTYLIISLVLATILRTPVEYLSNTQFYNFKLPRFLSVLLSFTGLLMVIVLFIVTFIPLISEQVRIISSFELDQDLIDYLSSPLRSMEGFMIRNNLTDLEEGFIIQGIQESMINWVSDIDFTSIFNTFISITGNIFIGIIAVVFITVVLLYEQGILKRSIIALIPNQYFEVSITVLNQIQQLLSNYLLGLLLQMFSIFTIASIGLSIVGVKYAFTIALFAAIANLIPYAGPLIGAFFGILVGVSTADFGFDHQMIFMIIKIISVFIIVQLTDNLLLQPLIFSKSVKAHPLEIFVVIFAGATIAGIIGMIVAIPVYTVIRVSA